MVKVPAPRPVCPTCQGAGSCVNCSGTGESVFKPGIKCGACNGSGSCRNCGGTGMK